MKKMLESLMADKEGSQDKDEMKKQARMDMVKELRKMATDAMASGMGDMKKVTVASPDSEGLSEGLEKAKQMLDMKKDKEDDEDEY